MTRPLSNNDMQDIANYLIGRKAQLALAVSELGFDPSEYPELRVWLLDMGIYQNRTGQWRKNNE